MSAPFPILPSFKDIKWVLFVLAVIVVVAAFAHFVSPPSNTPVTQHTEEARARAFLEDTYPGRRFRLIWRPDPSSEEWTRGFAVPIDEPRFPPVQIVCNTRRQEPCFFPMR